MNSPWSGMSVAAIIGIMDYVIRGSVSDTTILGLIGLCLLCAIFPPLGLMFGIVIVLYLAITNGGKVLGPFNSLKPTSTYTQATQNTANG